MNAKDKAQELVHKFWYITGQIMPEKFAIICVDEIIKALKTTTGHCELRRLDVQEVEMDINYWESVKRELNAL